MTVMKRNCSVATMKAVFSKVAGLEELNETEAGVSV